MHGDIAKIEAAMARRRMSGGQLATAMGNVYPATVRALLTRIRQGKPVRPASLGALAAALEVDVAEIIGAPPAPRKRKAAAMRQPSKAVRA